MTKSVKRGVTTLRSEQRLHRLNGGAPRDIDGTRVPAARIGRSRP
jgi:hypothetical protein